LINSESETIKLKKYIYIWGYFLGAVDRVLA